MPANTGTAGAIHRVAFFAGKPAPTGSPQPSTQPQYLWERACPRTPAQPVPCTALDSSRARPLPQDHHSLQSSHSTCGSGFTREHRRSRCHTPRRILRGHARSHRITTTLNAATVPVGAGSPANTAQPVPYTALDSSQVSQTATPPHRTTSESADQNTDHPIRELSNSSAAIPARELPAAFNSGDHTHTVNCPGTIATIPPPTPLLPGNPTR